MSTFEDYDRSADGYDDTRVPVGVDLVRALLCLGPVPLEEQMVLDAGCGTGSYLAALAGRVAELRGMDRSEGMLARARAKLKHVAGVSLDHGDVVELPYPQQHFDGVICNQVLHHLPCGEDGSHAGAEAFLERAFRVLRPGGVLIVSSSSHAQCADGFWWSHLVPDAMQRLVERLPDVHEMRATMGRVGFEGGGALADLDGVLQGERYLDPEGPGDPRWRAGDSTWTLASPEELEGAITRIARMTERGEIDDFLREREAMRRAVGQTTFVWAKRPGGAEGRRSWA